MDTIVGKLQERIKFDDGSRVERGLNAKENDVTNVTAGPAA